MKLTLVALPWSTHTRPSAALGALAAYVGTQAPTWEVEVCSAYVRTAATVGFDLYEAIAENAWTLGELFYLSHLHPDREPAIRAHFLRVAPTVFGGRTPEAFGRPDWETVYRDVRDALGAQADELAEGLDADVVGLTTCFGQLFANVLLARRLKARRPGVRVVLGGSTVSARVGVSVLATFPEIDAIAQGEGERPLVALLESFAGGAPSAIPGVLRREGDVTPTTAAALSEVAALGALPIPSYDEYATLADELGIDWKIPIEGSRGCWWDRARRTGNPRATCYFCNLNVQWSGYREKPVERVVSELDELTRRYANTKVYFLDNVLRTRGVHELAAGIAALGRDIEMFYEMRASVRPDELVALWEAGLVDAQFGVEALSTSLLARMGKGTRTLQNLEVMKLACELGIPNGANLITHFPGATQEEVDETVRVIDTAARAYDPCNTTRFRLAVDATVDALRGEFPVARVRNADVLGLGLPPELQERLALFDLDYDAVGETVDWGPVEAACARWRARHREVGGPLLVYHDGGTFLRITDRREDYTILQLGRDLRDVYVACMESRSEIELLELFAGRFSRDDLLEMLDGFVETGISFREGNRWLSLATAPSPRAAARRVKASRARARSVAA